MRRVHLVSATFKIALAQPMLSSAPTVRAGSSKSFIVASADTTGSRRASASGDQGDARVAGSYCNGTAVFTIVSEGIEGGASVEGERFSYRAGLQH